MLLFQSRFHPAIRQGALTRTYRLWKRPRVVAGRRYAVAAIGLVEVDHVAQVRADSITNADARAAGFDEADSLFSHVAATGRATVDADTLLYRVDFHFTGPDDRARPDTAAPAPDDLDALRARLDAMDRRSPHGPWTRPVLRLIADHPRVAASQLAPRLDRATQPFKADVRKLKKLGLTLSHDVGYEITPRGRALLD